MVKATIFSLCFVKIGSSSLPVSVSDKRTANLRSLIAFVSSAAFDKNSPYLENAIAVVDLIMPKVPVLAL